MKVERFLKVKCLENTYNMYQHIYKVDLTIGKFYEVSFNRLPYYHLIDDNGMNITHHKRFFITEKQNRINQLKLIGI